MAVVNEVITKFSFQGSLSPLKIFNSGLGSAIKSIGATYVAMAGVSAAMAKFTLNTTQSLDPMVQLSRTTGASVGKIQELGYIASVSGSSLQAVEGTIASLSEKIGSAAWQGNEDFARLGISVRGAGGELKTADTVLGEIQDRFRSMNLSKQEQMSFASRLGIDKSLIQLMRRSGSEMADLTTKARKLGTLTKSDADAAANLNDSMTTLKFGLSAVQNQIAVGLAPHMQKFSDLVATVLGEKKGLISKGVGAAVEFFVSLGRAVKDLFPIMAVAAGLMAAIWVPIPLLGAAAFLVIQDLMVAFRGGNSLIRDFVKEVSGIDITPGLRAIVSFFKDNFIPTLEYIKDIFKWMQENSPLARVAGAIGAISGGDFKGAAQSLDRGTFSGLYDSLKGFMFGSGSTTNNTSNSSVNQTVNIDVRSTESAETLARAIKSQISDASDQAMRGGM